MKKRGLLSRFVVAMALVLALGAGIIAMPLDKIEASETAVTVKKSALKKAKANIKLFFAGEQLDKNGFLVKANAFGESKKILYVPLDTFANAAGAQVSIKGKKVTITAMNAKVSFKKGKNSYTISDGDYKFSMPLGISYVKDDTLYVPISVIDYTVAMFGFKLQGEVEGKKYEVVLAPIDEEYDDGQDDEPGDGMMVGGFESVDSPDIPKDLAKKLKDLSIPGVEATPVALLAKQVVAGTNYKLLCRAKTVTPDAVEVYAFVTVYVDLQGNVEITDCQLTEVETNIFEGAMGGWSQPDSVAMNKQYLALFDKAMAELDGVSYTPIALLATQVVAGAKACVLCSSIGVYPGAQAKYSFVYLFVGLDQSVEITDIVTVE